MNWTMDAQQVLLYWTESVPVCDGPYLAPHAYRSEQRSVAMPLAEAKRFKEFLDRNLAAYTARAEQQEAKDRARRIKALEQELAALKTRPVT